MTIHDALRGTLFSRDFLCEFIVDTQDWQSIDDSDLDGLESALLSIVQKFPLAGTPNESQTEDDLIWPVLEQLGWTASLRQQNLSARGRDDVPDGLLFADQRTKQKANRRDQEWRRYELGLVIVESKRWLLPLDTRSGPPGSATTPSTQMLRYMRRADDLTTGRLRWGILTNGACWRLYYQGARSVSQDYFEIDLREVLGVSEYGVDLFSMSPEDRKHCLKVLALAFRRKAFLPTPSDPRTFHQRVISESRYHEERVAADLSDLVFGTVFPELARAISREAPEAPLSEVREAALVLLYRLLFIHYAEDRGLLPVGDRRYRVHALRHNVREHVRDWIESEDNFSSIVPYYWMRFDLLSSIIDAGDQAIGLPPYDGGLFDRNRVPLLSSIKLADATMAKIVDALSFQQTPEGRRYINYADLSVQQLGSIYERLLEQEIVQDGGQIEIRLNIFARRSSGSYYTPDELVGLIVDETVGPLVRGRLDVFESKVSEIQAGRVSKHNRINELKRLDPAESILRLRVCDPAMGSGHFLVRLVDYLADQVIAAMAEAESAASGYVSPVVARINSIRNTVLKNAAKRGWAIDQSRLDDRHIVRRMVLKRCVFGVDKNPMAVELAKVALWLHTFTVGAPLSFLDHHIQCGDSLFGLWVRSGIDKAKAQGGALFLDQPVETARQAEEAVQTIERLPDSEIAEADLSSKIFMKVKNRTDPLHVFLALVHAFDWMSPGNSKDRAAVGAYLAGTFGDPVAIATGDASVPHDSSEAKRFAGLLQEASRLASTERFLNWQVAFPGIWSEWEAEELSGGFDAIIGNPPWDRMKLQQVEWFSVRRPAIAMAIRAADRRRMIADLARAGDPLWDDFEVASNRATAASRIARNGGDFPYLGRGDMNLYSLFVERAMSLVNRDGIVGLLIPSGIAGDKTAAGFFRSVSTEGRLRVLFDFENSRFGVDAPPYFPAVHRSFKFCAFIASRTRPTEQLQAVPGAQTFAAPARCAFFLHSADEVANPDRWFFMAAKDFSLVNPNTGTAPIYRTRRAADITSAIYRRLPVLVDRSGETVARAWPVKYWNMFHMTNDSGLFRRREELEDSEGAWPIDNNRYDSPEGEWLPLYEGKMVQAFDHRAASIVIKPENRHRPAQPSSATLQQHQDPNWMPTPQYWVPEVNAEPADAAFLLAFKDVTAPTNSRSMIAAIVPRCGAGNTLPLILTEGHAACDAAVLVANLNAIPFDFVARQKIQGQHLNWFVVEQLPVVPAERYETVRFGPKSAGEIVREAVLELTYTSHDMAPFAREAGYVDASGRVKPPFPWDEARRAELRAKLDAVFFHLYGVTDRKDVQFIYSTFRLVEKDERNLYEKYFSRDLCLLYMNALSAGKPDTTIRL